MALTPEDLAALSDMIGKTVDQKLETHTATQAQVSQEQATANAALDYTRQAGTPAADPNAGPDYYVHLANGDVIETKDAGATHMEVDGETVAVIGRFQKEASPEVAQ
jgi:hypothetical protein